MMKLNTLDVRSIMDSVNKQLEQPSKTTKREFKADYVQQYGGWLIYYYNEEGRYTAPLGSYRVSHKEAYRFFEGILFSLSRF